MGVVAKEVKAMSQEDILAFEKAGEVAISNHCLKLTDIKVHLLVLFSFVIIFRSLTRHNSDNSLNNYWNKTYEHWLDV